ncbi:Biotin synthesis protein BioH [hydrothermal vent metagenome]|uniref:Biotin synthesis protein BioH n=1 Tax=hydrothermal vent metagenome TaxID=652676 RepID=A0A3B0WIE7_9ZZZZ
MPNSVTCVFVHGWAMNSAVWDECIEQLPDWINVVLVDLPGHGSMAEVSADSLDDYVQTLVPLVHRPVLWVGWSLGSLAVLRLAELYPQRVAAALLVASNPCFVRKKNWQCAVDENIFKQFASDLNNNQKKTIRRFLALQVKGLADVMQVVRQLQQGIEARGEASIEALNTGLNILLNTDLRQTLKNIDSPLHWLLGTKDALVPRELASVLEKDFAQKNVTLFEDASHAPFISQRDLFVEKLITVAQEIRSKQ